jgi:hypothetical protein
MAAENERIIVELRFHEDDGWIQLSVTHERNDDQIANVHSPFTSREAVAEIAAQAVRERIRKILRVDR